jgi:hypothetical protein
MLKSPVFTNTVPKSAASSSADAESSVIYLEALSTSIALERSGAHVVKIRSVEPEGLRSYYVVTQGSGWERESNN